MVEPIGGAVAVIPYRAGVSVHDLVVEVVYRDHVLPGPGSLDGIVRERSSEVGVGYVAGRLVIGLAVFERDVALLNGSGHAMGQHAVHVCLSGLILVDPACVECDVSDDIVADDDYGIIECFVEIPSAELVSVPCGIPQIVVVAGYVRHRTVFGQSASVEDVCYVVFLTLYPFCIELEVPFRIRGYGLDTILQSGILRSEHILLSMSHRRRKR